MVAAIIEAFDNELNEKQREDLKEFREAKNIEKKSCEERGAIKLMKYRNKKRSENDDERFTNRSLENFENGNDDDDYEKDSLNKGEEYFNGCRRKERFTNGFDLNGMITKIIKYLIEGITVSLVGMILLMNKNGGKGKYTTQAMEIIAMGVSAAAVFAILDTFAPAVSMSTRQGAGFGLGANLVGFPA